MAEEKLFHVSEEPGIGVFTPRPSPSSFPGLHEDVVFAVTGKLLHNYLLPRDCPRVGFYKGPSTAADDIEKFFAYTSADYILAVENAWLKKIAETIIYCYELPLETFTVLDEYAGYYVSPAPVVPVNITAITNILGELLARNIEVRFMPLPWPLADAVKQSTLQYSLIRMRNAGRKKPLTH